MKKYRRYPRGEAEAKRRRAAKEEGCGAKEDEEANKRRKKQEGELIEMYEDDGKSNIIEIDGKKLVHAWVMIAPGKRGITDSLFVESTTGRFYKTEKSPYTGVESIFNHRNYCVNNVNRVNHVLPPPNKQLIM